VAVIVLPGDVALESAGNPSATTYKKPVPPRVCPPDSDLDRLAELLNDANRVTLLCGSGCAGAHTELLKLGETLKAPMVHALRGKEYVEYDNPYDVGMTGLIGFSSGYHAMLGCDVLLMLGTDFPYRQFYPTDAKIVQVDIRAEKLGNRASLTMGLVGDVQSTITALLPRLREKSDRTFLDKALRHYQASRKELDDLATGRVGHKPKSPVPHQNAERGCRGGRYLHLRRRHSVDLGGALSHDEWQATLTWFLQSWVDGECDAAGNRRAGRPSRPPGDLTLR
jgi:pyruvate dehydrogenase (quinone)